MNILISAPVASVAAAAVVVAAVVAVATAVVTVNCFLPTPPHTFTHHHILPHYYRFGDCTLGVNGSRLFCVSFSLLAKETRTAAAAAAAAAAVTDAAAAALKSA